MIDIYKESENLEKKMIEILSTKIPDYSFSSYDLTYIENKDENYFNALKVFKFLYNLGGEAHTYLWNKMWDFCVYDCKIDNNDYSMDELKFINSIKEFYAQECKKYGEHYYRYQSKKNINNLFDSPRLLIMPYDSELNNKYISFFKNNHDEFETFYGREFDLDDLKYCNQDYRPLSFALIEKDTNEYIGSIALDLLRSDCVYNIEYYIFPTYRRYGYAKEALTRIIEAAKNKELKVLEETIRVGVYAEEYLNIKCIEARTSTENIASISLLKKCGFELMGKLPYYGKVYNLYFNAVQYDLMI